MKIWIRVLIFAVLCLAVCSQTCPSQHFSAIFTATIEQTTSTLPALMDDPELIHLKTYLKFRDTDIQHTTDDAIQFFNNTFGLDFSDSPNQKNERFFQNAKMSPFMFPSTCPPLYIN